MGAGKYLLIGGGIAAIAGYSYYKYAKNNFVVLYQGTSVKSVSSDYRTIGLDVEFTLSSKAGIEFLVQGLQFNVYLNGVIVGTGVQAMPIDIPGNGSVPMIVSTTVSLGNIEGSVFSSLLSKITGGGPMVVVIEGAVQAGVNLPLLSYFTLNYPFNQTEQLPL